MSAAEYLLCPICGNKTRDKIRADTELKNFPLFCPKCKYKTIISVGKFNMTVTKEPVAEPITNKVKTCGCWFFFMGRVAILQMLSKSNKLKKDNSTTILL